MPNGLEGNAEMGLIVKFEDESSSYVHGFEAGMLWQQMQQGLQFIDPELPVHVENLTTLGRMAKAAGYTMGHTVVDDSPEWAEIEFSRIDRALRLVTKADT